MNLSLSRLTAALAASSLVLCVAPAGAAVVGKAASGPQRAFVPGEVIVRSGDPADPRVRVVRTARPVLQRAAELARRPGVLSATPNWIARISAPFVPNDPGDSATPGGWQSVQWNFMPDTGVNAPQAWDNLIQAGRPGGKGAIVAVLDTGVAYSTRGRFRKSPDLGARSFVRGYDFVDNDRYPLDHNGHGTHVASTIVEAANNGFGVTGLAYGARVMPVRVLDRTGEGDSLAIAAGIRYAARGGADIINLSFEFSSSVTRRQIPDIIDAIRFAHRRKVLVVGASGNAARGAVAYPAKATDVLSVGATTEHLCQADYSNNGRGLDIAAPGGGQDADIAEDPEHCRPADTAGRDIFQVTFTNSVREFGLPEGYMGTSMAAPHVSAVAALVIASGVIGRDPTPRALEDHLKRTARDLGPPGYDTRYGAGLVDAAAATAPPAVTPPA